MPEPTFVQLVTRPPQRNTQTPSALFAILTAKEKDSDPDAEPPAEPTLYGTRDMELVFTKAYYTPDADGADPAADGVTRAPCPPAEPDDPPPDPEELTIRSVCPDAEIVLNSLPEEIATQIREAFDGGDEWWETVGKPKFYEAFEKMKELDPGCADPDPSIKPVVHIQFIPPPGGTVSYAVTVSSVENREGIESDEEPGTRET